jgi:hypothetical protein
MARKPKSLAGNNKIGCGCSGNASAPHFAAKPTSSGKPDHGPRRRACLAFACLACRPLRRGDLDAIFLACIRVLTAWTTKRNEFRRQSHMPRGMRAKSYFRRNDIPRCDHLTEAHHRRTVTASRRASHAAIAGLSRQLKHCTLGQCALGQLSLTWFLSLDGFVPPPSAVHQAPTASVSPRLGPYLSTAVLADQGGSRAQAPLRKARRDTSGRHARNCVEGTLLGAPLAGRGGISPSSGSRKGPLTRSLRLHLAPQAAGAIAYAIFWKLFGFAWSFQRVVPANAGTHTARTLVLSLRQRPFFTFDARGYGSLRSQGRPAESVCQAKTASTRPYAIAQPQAGRG